MNFVSTVLLTRHFKKIISTFNILDYRKDDDYNTKSIKLWYFVYIICSYCVLTLTTKYTSKRGYVYVSLKKYDFIYILC